MTVCIINSKIGVKLKRLLINSAPKTVMATFTKLFVYAGSEHEQIAQKPKTLEV